MAEETKTTKKVTKKKAPAKKTVKKSSLGPKEYMLMLAVAAITVSAGYAIGANIPLEISGRGALKEASCPKCQKCLKRKTKIKNIYRDIKLNKSALEEMRSTCTFDYSFVTINTKTGKWSVSCR